MYKLLKLDNVLFQSHEFNDVWLFALQNYGGMTIKEFDDAGLRFVKEGDHE